MTNIPMPRSRVGQLDMPASRLVFGCAIGVVTFFIVNAIEQKKGVAPAPSAYVDGE